MGEIRWLNHNKRWTSFKFYKMSLLVKLRPFATLIRNNGKIPLRTSRRNGGDMIPVYRNQREHVKEARWEIVVSYVAPAMFWWWFLYHVYYDLDHLFPPAYPDPTHYTDEELGIPPDDEE